MHVPKQELGPKE